MDGNAVDQRPHIMIPSRPISSYALNPRPHILTSTDITTINYTLEWPHLENPSNTTFAGPTQIDICRCPRSDPPPQNRISEAQGHLASFEQIDSSDIKHETPGHIYTRYKCSAPEVRFKSATEQLWVLDDPHGPINMLRPATPAERELRNELNKNAEPTAYVGKNIILLTGPCPRGRYQAYATLQYLKSLSRDARRNLERISLLIQPYEEDCVEESSKQAYSELAEYILQYLPGFKSLHLKVWDDEQRMRSAAGEFSILLHRKGVEIAVGWNWCKGEAKHYTSARAFLEAMSMKQERRRDQDLKDRSLEVGLIMKESKDGSSDGTEEAHDIEDQDQDGDQDTDLGFKDDETQVSGEQEDLDNTKSPTSEKTRPESQSGDSDAKLLDDTSRVSSQTILVTHEHPSTAKTKKIWPKDDQKRDRDMEETPLFEEHEQETSEDSREDGNNTDDDWIDAALSPVLPQDPEEGSWQVL